VRRRLKRLAQVRNTSDNYLLQDPAKVLSGRWEAMHPHITFRLDTSASAEQTRQELEQARLWLLRFTSLHARHSPRDTMSRILDSAVGKPANRWTDIEQLYMALTNEEHEDVKASLEYAWAVVLHYQYPENHAYALSRLQEHEDRRIRLEKKRSLPRPSQEAIRSRILHKLQSIEVNNFTCAVPISSFVESTSDDSGACPVCRNGYLDFASFRIEDLIADYPVKIKYCGHIMGRGCLETWMKTPLADPAKYPHHTCPLCRNTIEGVELPTVPKPIQQHVEENQEAISLAGRLGLEDEECWDATLGLISQEIVLEELAAEVQRKMLIEGEEKECLRTLQMVLSSKLGELEEEKTMWGFRFNQEVWKQAKLEWASTKSKPRVAFW
jgi:hypothetical protein